MSFFEFPHTRTYDSDLGYLIEAMRRLTERIENFTEINQIHFADPITWDITAQYPAFTIAFDNEGSAYISTQPVPAGVDITNTDYWTLLINGTYSQNIFLFDTVNDMLTSDRIAVNMFCKTRGFYTPDDGGGAYYYIVADAEANGIDILATTQYYAVIALEHNINLKQLGAASTVNDCAPIIERAIDLAYTYGKNIYIPEGDYYTKDPVQIYRPALKIHGGSYRTTRLIYDGDDISGQDPFYAPFVINAFYASESYEYDYEITDIQFVIDSQAPAVLCVNGLAYASLDHICTTPNANTTYAMWIGSVQQCVFNEIGTCPNMTGAYTASIEYGVFLTLGQRLSGTTAPGSTNNRFTNVRGEQCINGVFLTAVDNSQFINIAAEANSTRNLAIRNVRNCEFIGIASEGRSGTDPSTYGMQIESTDCVFMDGYEVCLTLVNGERNTFIGMRFDDIQILTPNHIIENCEYAYLGGNLTIADSLLPYITITNLYNHTTEQYYKPYIRTGITLDSNGNFENPFNAPILIFNASAITAGSTSIQKLDGTGTVTVQAVPFVLPAGVRMHSTMTGFSYVPLNIR